MHGGRGGGDDIGVHTCSDALAGHVAICAASTPCRRQSITRSAYRGPMPEGIAPLALIYSTHRRYWRRRKFDIPYLVISFDTAHYVTIYRDTPYDISHTRLPRNTRHKISTHRKPTTSLRSSHFFLALSLPSSWMCSSGICLSFFCCSPAGHIIGLTVSPANSNPLPSGLGLVPERMHGCFCLIFIFFSFLSSPAFFPS